jgi:hypothetical protein
VPRRVKSTFDAIELRCAQKKISQAFSTPTHWSSPDAENKSLRKPLKSALSFALFRSG